VTSGETLSRASRSGPAAGFTAGVVVVHGGQSANTEPTGAFQPAVLRMIPLVQTIRRTVRGSGALVCRPRLQVRGWNGEQASPVPDLNRILDHVGAEFGPVPVVLVGHSMGARAAFRVAGHPAVSAVAGLAPWLPAGRVIPVPAGGARAEREVTRALGRAAGRSVIAVVRDAHRHRSPNAGYPEAAFAMERVLDRIARQPNTRDAHRLVAWAQQRGDAGALVERLWLHGRRERLEGTAPRSAGPPGGPVGSPFRAGDGAAAARPRPGRPGSRHLVP